MRVAAPLWEMICLGDLVFCDTLPTKRDICGRANVLHKGSRVGVSVTTKVRRNSHMEVCHQPFFLWWKPCIKNVSPGPPSRNHKGNRYECVQNVLIPGHFHALRGGNHEGAGSRVKAKSPGIICFEWAWLRWDPTCFTSSSRKVCQWDMEPAVYRWLSFRTTGIPTLVDS